MRYIASVDRASSAQLVDGKILSEDFQAARRYLRYYQRGLVGFAVVIVLGVAVARLLPAGAVSDDWFPRGQAGLAASMALYVVAPYRHKLAAFY